MSEDGQAGDGQGTGDGQGDGDGQGTGDGQNIIPDPTWTEPLSDELKGHEHFGVLSKFKAEDKAQMVMVPGTLVKSHLEQQKILGAKGVLKPAEDAGEDDYNRYYDELGRPEKPTDYNIARPDFLEENAYWKKMGSIWNEDRIGKLAEVAHAKGLTKEQWEPLFHEALKLEMADLEAVATDFEDQYNTNVDALTKEWGPAYDRNVDLALKAAVTFGGQELVDELVAVGAAGNPIITKAFYAVAQRIGEHMLIADGESPIAPKLLTRDELQGMMADDRYTNPAHVEHQAFVRKVEEGYKKLAAVDSNK